MKRVLRMLAVLGLAVASVPVLATTAAQAAIATESATTGAYYWQANPGTVQGPSPIGAQKPFPDQAKGTDGVAEDDLPVAVTTVDRVDKFSALRWDIDSLLPGSVVSKAVIVVPLSDNATSRRTPNAAPALVQACAVGDQGFADADAEPFIDAPKIMCEAFKAAAKPVDGAYEFDITALAQKWVESNDGVALYPSEAGLKMPFQQVFGPKSTARLTIAFTPPPVFVEEPEAPFVPVVDTPVAPPSGEVGGGFTPGPGALPGVEPVAPGPEPVAVVPPKPTVVQPGGQAAVPVAAKAPMRFDAATWLAIFGGAFLLWLASAALGAGPARSAAAVALRRGGVAEQLASRQRPTDRISLA